MQVLKGRTDEQNNFLVQEVKRALKFMISQKEKGIDIMTALTQVKGSYGEEVHMHVSEGLAKSLNR